MGQIISGPGQGLPLPQSLYPPALQNAPIDLPTNAIGLAPGDQLPIPAGTWYVHTGSYCVLQILDPVTGIWRLGPSAAWAGGWHYVKSDGFTYRIANLTGCPVSAAVTAPGNGSYVQSSTTITATGGTSTWVPIVGGALSMTTATIVTANAGAGYGVAPLVLIPSPPPAANNPNGVGGIPATGYAAISSGTVSGFTFTNPGAGYPPNTTMSIALLPNPTDPNLTTGITLATVVLSSGAAGSITGALCTNPGVPITPANITLTVAGAGSAGTVTANVMQTVTAASVVGTLTGPVGTVSALLTTVGGAPSTGTFTNSPDFLYLAFRPRPAQIGLTVTGAATGSIAPQVGAIYDGGLFLSAPTAAIATNLFMASNAATITNAATLTLTMGSRADFVAMQPAP